MHWYIYTTDAHSILLHVSAPQGCHHQRVVKIVLSKWPVVCATVTHKTIKISVKTQEKPPKNYTVPVDQTKVAQRSVTLPYTSTSLLMYENLCAALGQCSLIQ